MKYDIINPVLVHALEAHGGWERWRERIGLSSSIRLGGDLWALKGTPVASLTRRATTDIITLWLACMAVSPCSSTMRRRARVLVSR